MPASRSSRLQVVTFTVSLTQSASHRVSKIIQMSDAASLAGKVSTARVEVSCSERGTDAEKVDGDDGGTPAGATGVRRLRSQRYPHHEALASYIGGTRPGVFRAVVLWARAHQQRAPGRGPRLRACAHNELLALRFSGTRLRWPGPLQGLSGRWQRPRFHDRGLQGRSELYIPAARRLRR
jgi:hypothetical protein